MIDIFVLAGHYQAARVHAVEIAAELELNKLPTLLIPQTLHRNLLGRQNPIVYVCWPTIYETQRFGFTPIFPALRDAEIRNIEC